MNIVLKQEIFDRITEVCLETFSAGEMCRAEEMLMKLMDIQGVPMHYPYHHYIMPAALLTLAAIERQSSREELSAQLCEAEQRARTVPGGVCGNCGSCGAAVGVGLFVSIFSGASPMARESWQWANEVVGKCLLRIASYRGPRCCKRTLFLAVQEGVPYIDERLNLNLEVGEEIQCHYHKKNADCLEKECPFYKEA